MSAPKAHSPRQARDCRLHSQLATSSLDQGWVADVARSISCGPRAPQNGTYRAGLCLVVRRDGLSRFRGLVAVSRSHIELRVDLPAEQCYVSRSVMSWTMCIGYRFSASGQGCERRMNKWCDGTMRECGSTATAVSNPACACLSRPIAAKEKVVQKKQADCCQSPIQAGKEGLQVLRFIGLPRHTNRGDPGIPSLSWTFACKANEGVHLPCARVLPVQVGSAYDPKVFDSRKSQPSNFKPQGNAHVTRPVLELSL
jgi:hypothetical protein